VIINNNRNDQKLLHYRSCSRSFRRSSSGARQEIRYTSRVHDTHRFINESLWPLKIQCCYDTYFIDQTLTRISQRQMNRRPARWRICNC